MIRERSEASRQGAGPQRDERPQRPPWTLIAACLVLVLLSTVLWVKWSAAQREAAKLQREMVRVYKEAEELRLKAALAQERISRLELELRGLPAEPAGGARGADDRARAARPRGRP